MQEPFLDEMDVAFVLMNKTSAPVEFKINFMLLLLFRRSDDRISQPKNCLQKLMIKTVMQWTDKKGLHLIL